MLPLSEMLSFGRPYTRFATFGVLAVLGFAFITLWSPYSILYTSTNVVPAYNAISRPVPLHGEPTERFKGLSYHTRKTTLLTPW